MDENVEKIISKITESAKASADEVIAEGKEKADKILADAGARADEIKANIIKEGQRQSEQEKKRIIADAKIKAKRVKLDAREEVIKEAFAQAMEELNDVDKAKYEAFLVSTAKQSSIDIGGGDVELLVRTEDKAILEPKLAEMSKDVTVAIGLETSVSVAGDTINQPGVVARADGGRVEVSNTFESRTERMRSGLRTEVAKVLFG